MAFLAHRSAGGYTLLSGNGGPVTAIATSTSDAIALSSPPAINRDGRVAFRTISNGQDTVFRTNGATVETVADSSGPFASFSQTVSINDAGTVLFAATLDNGLRGLFTGPNPVSDKVIATGDSLFGSTVLSLQSPLSSSSFLPLPLFLSEGLNDRGQIAFAVELTDGRRLLARANPVAKPDLAPDVLTWNATQDGLTYKFHVGGADLRQDPTFSLFWASGDKFQDRIVNPATGNAIITQVIQNVRTSGQTYGPFTIPTSILANAPASATHLLLVADAPTPGNPTGAIDESDEDNNVVAMSLEFAVPRIYQKDLAWRGDLLGTSQTITIGQSGCYLTAWTMALDYAGLHSDPLQLNGLLRYTTGFTGISGADLDPLPATSNARNLLAPGSSIHWEYRPSTDDKQALRDLLMTRAAPVIVHVFNFYNGANHNHFVLVTGLAGNNDFVINDPAYSDRTRLSVYEPNGSIAVRGLVRDPADLSVLNLSSASAGSGPGLIVRDAAGRMTGFDPLSGQVFGQIPSSFAIFEGPLENIEGGPDSDGSLHIVAIDHPGTGTYEIRSGGGNAQAFRLAVTNVTTDGRVQAEQVVAGPGVAGVPTDFRAILDPSQSLGSLRAVPSFSELTSAAIYYGASTTTLVGRIGAAGVVPGGTVSITLNGVTQTALIGLTGYFATTFDTHLLGPSSTVYAVT